MPEPGGVERLRHFYSQALGGEVVSGSVRARGWLLIFEVITDYKPPTWPLGETPKQMVACQVRCKSADAVFLSPS